MAKIYAGPGYNPVRDKLLQDARQRLDADLELYWEEANYTGVTLMSDGWTDTSHRPLMNVLEPRPRARASSLQRIARASTRMHSSLLMCGARAWSALGETKSFPWLLMALGSTLHLGRSLRRNEPSPTQACHHVKFRNLLLVLSPHIALDPC